MKEYEWERYSEKYYYYDNLGQYINLESAKRAVEFFWERESHTLLE
jgi:hypothetical protein